MSGSGAKIANRNIRRGELTWHDRLLQQAAILNYFGFERGRRMLCERQQDKTKETKIVEGENLPGADKCKEESSGVRLFRAQLRPQGMGRGAHHRCARD